MKSRITQYMERLCSEKYAENAHCDVTSSRVQVINTPIPTELFHELETISSEYKRDINCLAGDFLTMALQEAIAHIPKDEKIYLDNVRYQHDREAANLHTKQCEFNAGGT